MNEYYILTFPNPLEWFRKGRHLTQNLISDRVILNMYNKKFQLINKYNQLNMLYNEEFDVTTCLSNNNLNDYFKKFSINYNQYWAKLNEA